MVEATVIKIIMYTYNKKSKPVDTKFVLDELDKVKQAIRKLDETTDFLFASVLFEEAKELIKSYKTVTTDKVQRKFNIGYVRSSYLLEILEREGYIKRDKKNTKQRAYTVNKK
jgi:DNA segregation ATPase FtsK/SpoIIIE-like protein